MKSFVSGLIAIRPTSTEVERVFSTAMLVLTPELTEAKNVTNLSAPIALKKIEIRFAASLAMHSSILS